MEKQKEKLENKAARRYLRKVRALLPCSRKMKHEITAPLRRSLAEYLEERPDASAEDLRARFGAPEVIAASCLEEVETSDLLRRLRNRRRIIAVAITAAFLVLLSWWGFLAYHYYRLNPVYEAHEEQSALTMIP